MSLLKPRTRKLMGVLFIIILITLYAIIAVTIASVGLANAPWYAHLIFFATSGMLWIIPAMVIIKWMLQK